MKNKTTLKIAFWLNVAMIGLIVVFNPPVDWSTLPMIISALTLWGMIWKNKDYFILAILTSIFMILINISVESPIDIVYWIVILSLIAMDRK